MNWILTVVVKAVLEWLTSLLVRLRQKHEHIEQGRQEAAAQIAEAEKKAQDELNKLIKARANITDDDIARELRDGYNSNKANLPNN